MLKRVGNLRRWPALFGVFVFVSLSWFLLATSPHTFADPLTDIAISEIEVGRENFCTIQASHYGQPYLCFYDKKSSADRALTDFDIDGHLQILVNGDPLSTSTPHFVEGTSLALNHAVIRFGALPGVFSQDTSAIYSATLSWDAKPGFSGGKYKFKLINVGRDNAFQFERNTDGSLTVFVNSTTGGIKIPKNNAGQITITGTATESSVVPIYFNFYEAARDSSGQVITKPDGSDTIATADKKKRVGGVTVVVSASLENGQDPPKAGTTINNVKLLSTVKSSTGGTIAAVSPPFGPSSTSARLGIWVTSTADANYGFEIKAPASYKPPTKLSSQKFYSGQPMAEREFDIVLTKTADVATSAVLMTATGENAAKITATDQANDVSAAKGACDAFEWRDPVGSTARGLYCGIINSLGGALQWFIGIIQDHVALTDRSSDSWQNMAQVLRKDSPAYQKNPWVIQGWQITLGLGSSFIGVLLLIAVFANILRVNLDAWGIRKLLPSIITATFMASVSLLIIRFLVDVANVLTHGLDSMFAQLTNTSSTQDLGHALMNSLGIVGNFTYSTACSKTVAGELGRAATGVTDSIFIFILSLGMLIALIIIFFLLAIVALELYIRPPIVYLLTVVAPLAYIGSAFPFSFANKKSQWWSQLTTWIFMAPIIFFILELASLPGRINALAPTTSTCYPITPDAGHAVGAIASAILIWYAFRVPTMMGGKIMETYTKAGQSAGQLAGGSRMADLNKGWRDETGFRRITMATKKGIGEVVKFAGSPATITNAIKQGQADETKIREKDFARATGKSKFYGAPLIGGGDRVRAAKLKEIAKSDADDFVDYRQAISAINRETGQVANMIRNRIDNQGETPEDVIRDIMAQSGDINVKAYAGRQNVSDWSQILKFQEFMRKGVTLQRQSVRQGQRADEVYRALEPEIVRPSARTTPTETPPPPPEGAQPSANPPLTPIDSPVDPTVTNPEAELAEATEPSTASTTAPEAETPNPETTPQPKPEPESEPPVTPTTPAPQPGSPNTGASDQATINLAQGTINVSDQATLNQPPPLTPAFDVTELNTNQTPPEEPLEPATAVATPETIPTTPTARPAAMAGVVAPVTPSAGTEETPEDQTTENEGEEAPEIALTPEEELFIDNLSTSLADKLKPPAAVSTPTSPLQGAPSTAPTSPPTPSPVPTGTGDLIPDPLTRRKLLRAFMLGPTGRFALSIMNRNPLYKQAAARQADTQSKNFADVLSSMATNPATQNAPELAELQSSVNYLTAASQSSLDTATESQQLSNRLQGAGITISNLELTNTVQNPASVQNLTNQITAQVAADPSTKQELMTGLSNLSQSTAKSKADIANLLTDSLHPIIRQSANPTVQAAVSTSSTPSQALTKLSAQNLQDAVKEDVTKQPADSPDRHKLEQLVANTDRLLQTEPTATAREAIDSFAGVSLQQYVTDAGHQTSFTPGPPAPVTPATVEPPQAPPQNPAAPVNPPVALDTQPPPPIAPPTPPEGGTI